MKIFTITATLLCMSLILLSCANTKNVIYFNGLNDSTFSKSIEAIEPPIGKADILQITVTGLDPQASLIFNAPAMAGSTTGNSSEASPLGQSSGYLVNEEGFIKLPVLGQIKVEGTTKKALAGYLTEQLLSRKLLVDPIVTVRQTNFHITVLGEVRNPTVIPVPNGRINLMEAIGLAGDLTIEAKRDNVLLIREEGGIKTSRRLNLNSANILSSPYYYLRSNDIVYVEPGKAKASSTSQGRQLLPLIISSVSVAVLVIDRILN